MKSETAGNGIAMDRRIEEKNERETKIGRERIREDVKNVKVFGFVSSISVVGEVHVNFQEFFRGCMCV